jgi:hypothetical protein
MPTTYCRHVKVDGRRCLSFALRGKALCYFHQRWNERHRALASMPPKAEAEVILHPMTPDSGGLQREPAPQVLPPAMPVDAGIALPSLEDPASIQLALSVALQALASNRIDPKRAYTLLFGLNVASRNAQKLTLKFDDDHVVRYTTTDKQGTELAPNEDPLEIQENNAFVASLRLDEEDEDEDEEEDED